MKYNILNIKTIYDFSLLLFIEIYIYYLIKQNFLIIGIIILILFWLFRTKDKSFIYIIIIFLLFNIPKSNYINISKGKITEVHEKYSILSDNSNKIILYSDSPLLYDAEYIIYGNLNEISSDRGFYRFDFVKYCNERNIYYSINKDDYELLNENFTIRSFIQNKINNIDNKNIQNFCNRVLLNIKSDSTNNSWLFEHGFNYTALIYFLDYFFKFFLSKKKRNYITFILSIFLNVIYGFPLLLVQYSLFKFSSFFKLYQKKKTYIILSLLLIIYPYAYNSLSFILPNIYRLFKSNDSSFNIKRINIFLIIQSYFFNMMNLVQIFIYPTIRLIIGFLTILGFIQIIFPNISFYYIYYAIANMINHVSIFDINGSIIGFGFILFILFVLCFYKNKYFDYIFFVILLIFQIFGLFNPFAEISFINIGQGDSILIRLPLNKGNILIDTGKPSQVTNLETYLHAKGINKIDTLILTHEDDDHSGNRDFIIEYYEPNQIITEHFYNIKIGDLEIIDLNTIDNEDNNQSSIVNYLEINSLKILLMGDATNETEKEIIQKYNNLDIDILKLGHHGSNTSTSDDFLDSIRPRIGIISAGSYNLYHHPSSEVIQRLLHRHIPYFLTKEVGDISIICIGPINLLINSNLEITII